MRGLDDVPWHTLHHAYGTAEDVPELLRQLQTADPTAGNEDSPLWHLYGNIWHQGTVYEATSYAVPFLIQLVEDPATPDRVGILGLLAAIARGSSYLDVHEEFVRQFPVQKLGVPGTDEFERKKARELEWVESAHSAVAQGYEVYTRLTQSQTEIGYAAGNILACLRIRPDETSQLLLNMLREERRSLYRGGLVILIGEHGYDSPEVHGAVIGAASSASLAERRAAAITVARLKSFEISGHLREALVQAICDDDLAQHFEGLPWDVSDSIDQRALLHCDDSASRMAVNRLLELAEAGSASEASYDTLCQLLFDPSDSPEPGKLSTEQQRTLNAIIAAIDVHGLSFHTSFTCYGLPDSKRQLRRLAAGQPMNLKIDERLPVIGDPSAPAKPLALWKLKSGDRIHNRYFGLGTVHNVTPRKYDIELIVDFDEEGRTTLGLIDSPPRYVVDAVRYFLRRLLRRE